MIKKKTKAKEKMKDITRCTWTSKIKEFFNNLLIWMKKDDFLDSKAQDPKVL